MMYARNRGRHAVPDDDDLRGRARDRARPRDRRASGCRASSRADYDPRFMPADAQARRDAGDGDDREAGRLGRAREHDDAREPLGDREYRIVGHKWFFSAPMSRCLPDPRAGAGRTVVLLPAALHARRRGQRHPHPAAEGQAGRPLQRGLAKSSSGARAPRSSATKAAACRSSSRWAPTAASTARWARPASSGRRVVAGAAPRGAPRGLRQASRGAAADAQRARRPRARVGGGDGAGAAPRAAPSMRRTTRTQSLLRRVLTPAAKYWICKRGPAVAAEAMEVLGGNGYVEDGPMARIYRQMPLNSIWEGSGNVMCLDVLRAMAKHPRCLDALAAEVAPATGRDPRFDAFARHAQGCAAPPRERRGTRAAVDAGASRCWCRARCCCGSRRISSPTRFARAGSRRRNSAAARSATCRAAAISPAIIERAWPAAAA